MAALNGAGNTVPRWQRIWLDTSVLVLVATGIGWLAVHYTLGPGHGDIGLPHWSEAWWVRIHGFASFAALIAIGMFLGNHVPRGLQLRLVRPIEIVLLACLALTIATAFSLYYLVPESARPAVGWLHAAVAACWAAVVVWHRRRKRWEYKTAVRAPACRADCRIT